MSRADSRVASDPLGALVEVCHAPFLEAWDRLDDRIGAGLHDAVAEARKAHRVALERAGLDGSGPEEARERSDLLVAYGREVAAEVLKPLQTHVERAGAAVPIGRLFTEAFEKAANDCRTLPRALPIPWPEEALQELPEDGSTRRLGKVLARWVSAARHTGQLREVPLRAVAVHHITHTVIPAQSTPIRATLRVWAQWMGALESGLAIWADAALPVLFSAEAMSDIEAEDVSWSTVAEAARALDHDFAGLTNTLPHHAIAATTRARMGRAHAVLKADLALAGSFLYRPRAPVVRAGVHDLEAAVSLRAKWEAQIVSRMKLHTSLFAILSGASAVQARLSYRMREACVEPTQGLSEVATRLDEIAGSLEAECSTPDVLQAAHTAAREMLDEGLLVVPDPTDIQKMVEQGASATVEALQAMVRQVPASLTLHPVGTPAGEARGTDTRTLPLQSMAGQAFDAMRMERIRAAAAGAVEALTLVCADATKLTEVVDFGFEAAAKEVEAAEVESDGCASGAQLACEALRRAADSLQVLPESLDRVIVETRDDVAEEVAEGCEALFERAGARRVQAQLLAARSRVSDFRVEVAEALGPLLTDTGRFLKARWARLRRSGTRTARTIAGFFGAEPVAQARSSRTIRTLAAADIEGQSAPLVYQKLFTLEPISDPALLVGRDNELNEIMSRWMRWSEIEDGVPSIVIGRSGSGVSSFIGVVCTRWTEDGATVSKVPLLRRFYHEGPLAALLAEALQLPPTESLDDLARAVLEAGEGVLPDAIAVDGLEHVYLRTPGGTDLMERLLTFMSETVPRVFWIGGITTSAWQLVQKSEPTAVSQIDRLELSPLSAAQLGESVMRRHRRSGLQLRFVEPEGRRLLRRRLRRRRGIEAQQELLREDFFEHLHRASLGTLRLALFQWLQFAVFDTNDGVVRLRPVDRPDFSLLESLDLTQNFTLKAFLEHGTLTLGEHDAVFRIPRHESYQIFESLGNRHLIEPIDRKEGERRQSEIVEGLRYRVRPLLTGAVIAHLERRNIVH